MTAYRYPESHVFYRKLGRAFPRIVRGEGCWLIDEHGKRYLDAVGGAYVANLGHSNGEIADAMAQQARQFGYLSATAFTHAPVEELAAELAATLPGDLDKLYFLSSGSEAVEAALKLARQYWVERGRPEKHKVVALAPAYHGNTLLALSASAREHYQTMFREWLVDVHRVAASYPYRCPCRGHDPGCPVCSGVALEAAIVALGADRVAAFIAEPVGGSSTGASTPRPALSQAPPPDRAVRPHRRGVAAAARGAAGAAARGRRARPRPARRDRVRRGQRNPRAVPARGALRRGVHRGGTTGGTGGVAQRGARRWDEWRPRDGRAAVHCHGAGNRRDRAPVWGGTGGYAEESACRRSGPLMADG